MDYKTFCLTSAAAECLGGFDAIGRAVRSETDLAAAADVGFTVKATGALENRGATDRKVSHLIIKPRTLSHRQANRHRLTVEEFDRAIREARAMALARRTFANDDKAHRWLHRNLNALGGRTPMEGICTDAGARLVENLRMRIHRGAPA